MDVERTQSYYDTGRSWGGWLEAPRSFKTLRYYREARIFAGVMQDGIKYPWYAEYGGPGAMAVARGMFEHALGEAGIPGADQVEYTHNVAKSVLMARRLTQFGVQITRVSDALSQWTSAARFRQVEVGVGMGKEHDESEEPPRVAPSLRVWVDGILRPLNEHARQLLVATVNLGQQLFELWMCWLDVEDARRFNDKTLQDVAIYLAPIHLFEAGDNVGQLLKWGAEKGGVPYKDDVLRVADKLRNNVFTKANLNRA